MNITTKLTTIREAYSTFSTLEEEKPPNEVPLMKKDDLEQVHIVVKKISMTQFEEVPLEAWKDRYTLGHLCQELMVCRSLLTKHGNGDHGFCRLPLEIIVHILTYITEDWLRVVFLQSMRRRPRETTVLTFLHTTNLKDVCRYLGMKTSNPPHYHRVGWMEGDKLVYINPYDTSLSVVEPKGSTVFVWVQPRCKVFCSQHTFDDCNCALQRRKKRIEKYKNTNNL